MADRNTLTRLLIAATLTSLCQCSNSSEDEDAMSLDVPSPIALGATATVTLQGKTQTKLLLDDVRVEDGSIFRIIDAKPGQQVASVQVESLREGTTTFRARGDNGQSVKSVEKSVRSALPDRLTFTVPGGCKVPLLYGTDYSFTLGVQRHLGSSTLYGTGGVYPLAAEGAQAEGPTGLTFKTSATPAKGSIRSTVNSTAMPFEVFAREQVTTMVVAWTRTSVQAGVQFEITANVVVNQDTLCADAFPREVAIETPDVCDHVSTSGSTVNLLGRRAGTCTVKVKLAGSAVEAKGSFPVKG